ncbi:hypothetical protein Tco_0212076 [Tanacetum coccineum]
MSLYSIPHGSTSNYSCSTCSKISYYWEMQQLRCALEYSMLSSMQDCGKILLDHPLNYALTATADVPTVSLQQFWRTVSKVHDTEDTIKFMLETEEFTYIVDMFRFTLHLLVETPENPFVAPVNIQTIEAFMNRVGYQGMLIPDEFLTEEIHATDDYKEYETVSTPRAHRTPTISTASPQGKKRKQIVGESSSPRKSHKITIKKKKQSKTSIPPPCDDQERDEVAEATILSLTLHKTALAAEAQENIAKVQEKLDEEEIEKMVEGEGDKESYASEFADSMINDDVDDSGTNIEPGSHKEHPKNIIDDDEKVKKEKNDEEIEKEKKDKEIEKETNIDDVEKTDEVVKEKDIDVATGSTEIRKEQKQTPIPSPTRSPRNVSSSDKIVSEELTATVSPTTTTTSKDSSTSKRKKRPISYKTKILPGKVLDHCNKVVPELTFAKTNEMINKEMPCLVNLVVNKDREVDPINAQEMISKEFATHAPKMIEELFRKHMQHRTLNLYPTTSSSTAKKSTADLQNNS